MVPAREDVWSTIKELARNATAVACMIQDDSFIVPVSLNDGRGLF